MFEYTGSTRQDRICPKCKAYTLLVKYYVYPIRHYGACENTLVLYICSKCINKLEARIPFLPKKRDCFYKNVLFQFFGHRDIPLERE